MYFKNSAPVKTTGNINYISPSVLRSIFLIKLNPINKSSERTIFSRSSSIPKVFLNTKIFIHKGKGYSSKYINQYMIGFRFGNFTWNRKIAFYKNKQIKKKKK